MAHCEFNQLVGTVLCQQKLEELVIHQNFSIVTD